MGDKDNVENEENVGIELFIDIGDGDSYIGTNDISGEENNSGDEDVDIMSCIDNGDSDSSDGISDDKENSGDEDTGWDEYEDNIELYGDIGIIASSDGYGFNSYFKKTKCFTNYCDTSIGYL